MYENNFKNELLSKLYELKSFLEILADLDVSLNLYAMGGTAMVLASVKESTRDIDFMVENIDLLRSLMLGAGFKLIQKGGLDIWSFDGIRINIFSKGYILGVDLINNWKNLSEKIFEVGKINVYILNWYDICITKIIRCESRDLDDVKDIFIKNNLDLEFLKQRYFETCLQSIVSKEDEKWRFFLDAISKFN